MARSSAHITDALKSLKANLEEFRQEFVNFASRTEDRFNRLYELADGLAGDFKRFDEEQTVLSDRQGRHSDRIEQLETTVFGATKA